VSPFFLLYLPPMRLHLLDGTYELFRSFFGAPPRSAPNGMEVGAVHGIMASTLALLDDGVTHLGVAFDTVIRSFRNDLYDGYKSEAGVPETLLAQFPIAEEALEAMGVVVWRMVEYEADDGLASAIARFGDDFEQVVVMSPDKDLAQCVEGTRIVGFDRRRGAFIDADGVVAKFGVLPESIPDYLGLVGDSSDGFPGVPGWGAKSASLVLAEYRHIEAIPLEAALWAPTVRGAERLVASLRDHMGDALLFRFLAVLRRDAPLPQASSAELAWPGVPRGPFEAFCAEWGFDTLASRPKRWV
jgi:5'-3' exonuclease